ncbi:hypothetical protein CUMW_268520 [Citrus unshiu]|uniref:Uncharacterized protein n=1 Tax=Citrus unshiu TaxID=55188 RepID=A0A2H5QWL4_CITUN|nr:hypothetical protein CUMW_268520 [Citrus unshiu]
MEEEVMRTKFNRWCHSKPTKSRRSKVKQSRVQASIAGVRFVSAVGCRGRRSLLSFRSVPSSAKTVVET